MIASLRLTGTVLLVLFTLILSATFTSCESTTDSPADDNTVRIGALLALSGQAAPFGRDAKGALDVSVTDFNHFLDTANSDLMIEIDSADTQGDPTRALQMLDEMADRGIKIIIGPQTPDECRALVQRAHERGVLLLSPSVSLPAANDNFFSMVPPLSLQGDANAAYFQYEGITHAIVVRNNDVWAEDMLASMRPKFQMDGGTIDQEIVYDLQNVNPVTVASQLSTAVASAVAAHGASKVGVFMLSFGRDAVMILNEAIKDPSLEDVKWLGNSTLENDHRLEDPTLVPFLQRVGFPCSVFGIDPQAAPIYEPVQNKLFQKLGHDGDSHTLSVYDALWIAAYAMMDAGSDDAETLRKVLMHSAQSYYGATGWTGMNAEGNRLEGHFDFWSVRSDLNGHGMWYRSYVYERQKNGTYILKKLE